MGRVVLAIAVGGVFAVAWSPSAQSQCADDLAVTDYAANAMQRIREQDRAAALADPWFIGMPVERRDGVRLHMADGRLCRIERAIVVCAAKR